MRGGGEEPRGYSGEYRSRGDAVQAGRALTSQEVGQPQKSLRNLNAAAGSGRQGSNKQAVIPPLSPTVAGGQRAGQAKRQQERWAQSSNRP